MEERIFRALKKSEIRVIKPTLIELKAEEGWLITDADKSLKTETEVVDLPSEKYITDYCCINKVEELIEEI